MLIATFRVNSWIRVQLYYTIGYTLIDDYYIDTLYNSLSLNQTAEVLLWALLERDAHKLRTQNLNNKG